MVQLSQSVLLALISSISLINAVPTTKSFHIQSDNQVIQDAAEGMATGYTLDLSELRLVQFGEDEPPVWITELDKIEAKGKGRKFMDMQVSQSRLQSPHAIQLYMSAS